MQGFVCERCGFVAEGLFAKDAFLRHAKDHDDCDRRLADRTRITDADRVFLKIQKIVWDE